LACLSLACILSWQQPTLIGLGHALRKQCKWDAARAAYEQALALMPRSASTLSALAFTAQLAGDNATAIELYHHALGITPDDRFSLDMLDQAVADEAGQSDTSWMMT
jgi:anaphase-promoting complex subunit 6